jgi:chemotaxis protein CheZ
MLIFEACGFQDLTGQRISKIVTTLQHIEERIAKITAIFGEHFQSIAPAVDEDTDNMSEEEKLKNGPQLPANANDQADIDALLASFD